MSGPHVVAVSPHLDDAVFSVGGLLALLGGVADVLVLTCFTGSVPTDEATDFALSTQLDKGLPPDVDYMALRREEDRRALAVLGVPGRHLGLLEAPHRGYGSPAELFAGRHPGDTVGEELAAVLAPLLEDADVVLAPQALGDHVDHQWVGEVVADLVPDARRVWWRDTPYVVRRPDATPLPQVAGDELAVDVGPVLTAKVVAVGCYRTQVPFQFGSAAAAGPALRALAAAEGRRCGLDRPAEVVRASTAAARDLLGALR